MAVMSEFFAGQLPRKFAHRGASGTHPENTMEAFRAGHDLGAEAFELDVHRSADGHIIVFHDDVLGRTTDGSGSIRDRPLADLERVDAGFRFSPDGGRSFPFRGSGVRIPAFREVLEAFPETPIIVEIKQDSPPLEEDLARLLRETDSGERCLVFSLEQAPLMRYRELEPEQPTGFGPDDVSDFLRRLGSDSWNGYRPPAVAFAVPTRWHGTQIVSRPFIDAAHGFGCEVYVWTVNDPREMEALLDLGVDGLITDFPERLSRLLAGRMIS
jgi:glycerophosphoryl diester phosphodiesterase